MERVEIIASEGYKLTQVAEVDFENRIYVSRVYTLTPEDWKEVPISEYEEWKEEMDKRNPFIGEEQYVETN